MHWGGCRLGYKISLEKQCISQLRLTDVISIATENGHIPEEGGSFILLIPILLKMTLSPLPGNKPNFSHEQYFQKNTDTFSNLGNSTEP